MTDLHVGQQVVCVDNKPRLPLNIPTHLTEGTVYTISSIEEWDGKLGVTLVEVPVPYANKLGWHADRFRPVAKTDIASLQALLKTTKKKEYA